MLTLTPDVAVTGFSSDGTNLLVTYDILDQDATPFDIGIYRSSDGTAAETLLNSHRVTEPADLAVGAGHSISISPDFADPQEDYFPVVVLDSAGEVSETDESNNQMAFEGGLFLTTDGTLHLQGTESGDSVDLSLGSSLEVTFGSQLWSYDGSAVRAIHVRTHGLSDRVTRSSALTTPMWIFGGEGDDALHGGAAGDLVDGGDGDDELYGQDGADTLYGGYGADHVSGGSGPDAIYGDTAILASDCMAGADVLDGGPGDDTLYGEDGGDTLYGGEGSDILYGGYSNDVVYGEAGNGDLFGEDGGDILYGGDGNDQLDMGPAGGGDTDLMHGGPGFDHPEIVDDGEADHAEAGTWWDDGYAYGGSFNDNQRRRSSGTGANKASWTFNGLATASYDVYITWSPDYYGVATDAPFTVYDGSTSLATVSVDQTLTPSGVEVAGVPWELLGNFTVASGTLVVELTDDANGDVLADAVRVVSSANSAPVAVDDSYQTDGSSDLMVHAAAGVLANDNDADQDPLSASLVSGPSHGTLTLNPDGSFTYTPDANFGTSDTSPTKRATAEAARIKLW